MADKAALDSKAVAARLREVANRNPELIDLVAAAGLFGELLPLLRSADLSAGTLSITGDIAAEKMRMGLPLLVDIELELDLAAVRKLMISLAAALETFKANACGGPNATAPRDIRLAAEDGRLDTDQLISCAMTGDITHIRSMATDHGLDADLLVALARNALKPALREWCRQLEPVTEKCDWHKSYCPVCGAAPVLGELREDHQAKYLRCGQCGAGWPAPRLKCTVCGNVDHKTIGYLYAEDQPAKILAEVCDDCGGYLKVINAYQPTPAEMLPVEDLATLHIDHIAKERGYAREPKAGK
jgi:FdhE protein